MSRTATLERTITIVWEDAKAERQCDVRVVYEYDGDRDFAVLEQDIVGAEEGIDVPHGLTEGTFNALVDNTVFEYAYEDYPDWLSGQADVQKY